MLHDVQVHHLSAPVLLTPSPLCPPPSPQDTGPPAAASVKGVEAKSKPPEEPESTKKWAIPVDISSPCLDFYKRIPNPAFKVSRHHTAQSRVNRVRMNWV